MTSQRGEAVHQLGAELSGSEARRLADALEAGETVGQALQLLGSRRRQLVAALLEATGMSEMMPGEAAQAETIMVLRAIEGAHAHTTAVQPVWTIPRGFGGIGAIGSLTASIRETVASARTSVTAATFNMRRSSGLWQALVQASSRPEVQVRVYLDTEAADKTDRRWHGPTTLEVAGELAGAVVMRTRADELGRYPRTHAKFVTVDSRILLVTSANVSLSAEELNVELGLRLDDPVLAGLVEEQMRRLEGPVYERVPA